MFKLFKCCIMLILGIVGLINSFFWWLIFFSWGIFDFEIKFVFLGIWFLILWKCFRFLLEGILIFLVNVFMVLWLILLFVFLNGIFRIGLFFRLLNLFINGFLNLFENVFVNYGGRFFFIDRGNFVCLF